MWPVFMATGTLCIPISSEPREAACARPPRFRAVSYLPVPVAAEISLPSKRRGFGKAKLTFCGALYGCGREREALGVASPHVVVGAESLSFGSLVGIRPTPCFLALRKIPSPGELKTEQKKVQGHPQLPKEFESVLSSKFRACL